MKKTRCTTDSKLASSLEDVLAHKKGKLTLATYSVPVPNVDIRSIRDQLELSQREFSERFRIPLGTLQGWEQGRRDPDYVAQIFLRMIDTDPQKVDEIINNSGLRQRTVV